MSRYVAAGLIAGTVCMAAALVAWCAVRLGSEWERDMERWEWMQ